MAEKIAPFFSDEAFLIKSVPYGESHLILHFLTQEKGRISLMALGAKKSKRRFAGLLDYLNQIELTYRPSYHGKLGILETVELKEGFSSIRKDYERTWVALSWLQLLGRLVPEGAVIPEIFSLLQQCLKILGYRSPQWVDLVFQKKLLGVLGYQLELGFCSQCGDTQSGSYFFEAQRGGFLCQVCAGEGRGKKRYAVFDQGVWFLDTPHCPVTSDRLYEALEIMGRALQELVGVKPGVSLSNSDFKKG